MSTDPAFHLPEAIRQALRAEIDPGESLRWCGMPLVSRMTGRILPASVAIGVLGVFFGGAFLRLALSVRAQLLGVETVPPGEHPSWEGVLLSIALGALLVLASVLGPIGSIVLTARRARRTVFAVTGTRVFKLWLDGRGRARTVVVEPSHPLSLSRHDLAGGRGDLHLYPRAVQPTSMPISLLPLIGIADVREVERLIRATFDPARPSAPERPAVP